MSRKKGDELNVDHDDHAFGHVIYQSPGTRRRASLAALLYATSPFDYQFISSAQRAQPLASELPRSIKTRVIALAESVPSKVAPFHLLKFRS